MRGATMTIGGTITPDGILATLPAVSVVGGAEEARANLSLATLHSTRPLVTLACLQNASDTTPLDHEWPA